MHIKHYLSFQSKKPFDLPLSFITIWFLSTFATLSMAIFFAFYLSVPVYVPQTNPDFQLYAALPENHSIASDSVGFQDARTKIVSDFFKSYKSLLADYSNVFIQVADKYHLDYRLLPAISMQESLGGKRVIPNSHNPFGYGIYGSKVTKFISWEAGIETVGKGLRENYLDEGLETPEEIMAKYTPPSLGIGGVWAKGVNHFMEELK